MRCEYTNAKGIHANDTTKLLCHIALLFLKSRQKLTLTCQVWTIYCNFSVLVVSGHWHENMLFILYISYAFFTKIN